MALRPAGCQHGADELGRRPARGASRSSPAAAAAGRTGRMPAGLALLAALDTAYAGAGQLAEATAAAFGRVRIVATRPVARCRQKRQPPPCLERGHGSFADSADLGLSRR